MPASISEWCTLNLKLFVMDFHVVFGDNQELKNSVTLRNKKGAISSTKGLFWALSFKLRQQCLMSNKILTAK